VKKSADNFYFEMLSTVAAVAAARAASPAATDAAPAGAPAPFRGGGRMFQDVTGEAEAHAAYAAIAPWAFCKGCSGLQCIGSSRLDQILARPMLYGRHDMATV
jgi:hypothetical protein